MVDWCIDELRHKASLFPESPSPPPPVVVYNGDVVKSDFAVSSELKSELQKAMKAFEDKTPEHLKDWHPNSDGKVLDLVHPSLYPLVYGLTRVLPNGETTTLDDCIERSGQGRTAPVPNKDEISDPMGNGPDFARRRFPHYQHPFSAKFQWLPCEIDISGEEAKYVFWYQMLSYSFF